MLITDKLTSKIAKSNFRVQKNFKYPRNINKEEDRFTCIGYVNHPEITVNSHDSITTAAVSFIKPFFKLFVEKSLNPGISWLSDSPFAVELSLNGDRIERIDFSIDLSSHNQKTILFHPTFYRHDNLINIKHHTTEKVIIDTLVLKDDQRIIERRGRKEGTNNNINSIQILTALIGEGLHRHIVKNIILPKELLKITEHKECNLLLLDYISEDTYIDLDEIRQISELV